MDKLIDLNTYPVSENLKALLKDKTTKKNIIFATSVYSSKGTPIKETEQMTEEILKGFTQYEIQPRVLKNKEQQQERTRAKAEVFTPSWICNKMNNHCDEEWFGRKDVFNVECEQGWLVNTEKVEFDTADGWKKYVDSKRLEITCGEAPYIVSRYDAATGELLEIRQRIGILDRKLRVVNENTDSATEWFKWVLRAYQSVYGYEFQGDSLLIARINLLITFVDYINQQTHTADVKWHLEWKGNATFDDGSGETFIDKDFHAYLRKSGIEQENGKNNEWFHVDGTTSKQMFRDFREDHGIIKTTDTVIPYKLREEQQRAVAMTVDYQAAHKDGEFLWNAKPRFGKTLSVYDFVQKTGAEKVLIVTNRPAIANSWFLDYAKFLGSESGYLFVSEVDELKGKRGVLTREEYTHFLLGKDSENVKCIEFVSLQDMKGSIYFGGQYDKLGEVANMEWDILVIDEAHEGVDTYKTDVAFDRIKRKFTLHLSGTPFKALANNKFADDAIYNWTYADEQKKKRDWDVSAEEENPYSTLPQLNLYTYQMSEIIKDELQQGIEIDGETEEYAFDLNEFFAVTNGKFNHESSVDKFLDALTRQTKFPFSTEELRDELKHTFWLLDRVDSAKALAKKLREHPIFQEYEVVLAAGDGKLDDDEETMKSYDKVVAAIAQHEKTITLSVGQLTTGITIPEWTAVLMLSNMRSPALYIQAAFRAQNPCLFKVGTSFKRKENAYVFDFDPARTLTIFEQFAKLQALRWISSSFCVMVVTMWRKKPDRPSTLTDSYSIRWYLMIR